MSQLAEWDSFYVIVGTAAGALIGLQFVVMTLIATRPTSATSAQAGAAYATPTVVHFSIVLLLSALLRAPWHAATALATVSSLVGLGGLAYAFLIVWRMRRSPYRPVFEDWLFHAVLPVAAYALLVLSPWAAISYVREALFGVGAGVLLLLFVGIHNAWDATTYHIFVNLRRDAEKEKRRAEAVEKSEL